MKIVSVQTPIITYYWTNTGSTNIPVDETFNILVNNFINVNIHNKQEIDELKP